MSRGQRLVEAAINSSNLCDLLNNDVPNLKNFDKGK